MNKELFGIYILNGEFYQTNTTLSCLTDTFKIIQNTIAVKL